MGVMFKISLDRKVVFDEEVVTRDPTYGSNVTTWNQITAAWAEVVDGLPSRSLAAQQGLERASVQTRVRVRYNESLVSPSRKRIRFGDRTLQVVGGPAEIGRRDFLEFLAEELTTVGGPA